MNKLTIKTDTLSIQIPKKEFNRMEIEKNKYWMQGQENVMEISVTYPSIKDIGDFEPFITLSLNSAQAYSMKKGIEFEVSICFENIVTLTSYLNAVLKTYELRSEKRNHF